MLHVWSCSCTCVPAGYTTSPCARTGSRCLRCAPCPECAAPTRANTCDFPAHAAALAVATGVAPTCAPQAACACARRAHVHMPVCGTHSRAHARMCCMRLHALCAYVPCVPANVCMRCCPRALPSAGGRWCAKTAAAPSPTLRAWARTVRVREDGLLQPAVRMCWAGVQDCMPDAYVCSSVRA